MTTQPNTNFWQDTEVISSYSRAQALEDGVLVDLNQWIPINESGYKYSVACTAAVWNIIDKAVKNTRHFNDYAGVIWDILWMSRAYQIRRWETGNLFKVKIVGAGRKQLFIFKIECGPGDDAEPVITVMFQEED